MFTFESLFASFLVLRKAKTNVIGIIESVLVILTMAAVSRAFELCIASHAEAAAVTDEVSFTAVPAKRPKP